MVFVREEEENRLMFLSAALGGTLYSKDSFLFDNNKSPTYSIVYLKYIGKIYCAGQIFFLHLKFARHFLFFFVFLNGLARISGMIHDRLGMKVI